MFDIEKFENYNVLGYLHYHSYKISLKSNDDETVYVVQRWYDDELILSMKLDNLSAAMALFTDAISDIFYRTSYTDVSIYMQQKATPEPKVTIASN